MNHFLLLDVAPDPVSTGIGIAGLVLIGIVVFDNGGCVRCSILFSTLYRLNADSGTTLISIST